MIVNFSTYHISVCDEYKHILYASQLLTDIEFFKKHVYIRDKYKTKYNEELGLFIKEVGVENLKNFPEDKFKYIHSIYKKYKEKNKKFNFIFDPEFIIYNKNNFNDTDKILTYEPTTKIDYNNMYINVKDLIKVLIK